MQVSVETTTGLERRLTIAVPAEEVDAKVNKKLSEVAKTATIKGFRKGKVPFRVVNRQFGSAARQEVAGDVINSSYAKALEQADVHPAGHPAIEINTLEAGQDLEYVATIEVYPEIELSDFSSYELTRISAEIKEADIDNAIGKLREQRATFREVDRAAADGDQVTIDFLGTRDGEEFQGGKGSGVKLVLGSGSMIPGFEEGIAGMHKGDNKVLSLVFPEEYQDEELRSAAVEFSVTLHGVEEKELPNVDREFMKHFGNDSMDQFRDDVKKNMERELKRAIRGKLKASVMGKLVESHKVATPRVMIAAEIETLRKQMMRQFDGIQKTKHSDLSSLLPDDLFREKAEKRVVLGLIIGEIIKLNELKADPDRVREAINDEAAAYEKPEDVVNYYYGNQQMLAGIESIVLEDTVVDLILQKAKTLDRIVSFEEAVTPDNRT